MSNANNNVVLVGTVMTNVQFLTTRQGVKFAARFMLAVKKGYKKADGYEATDLIPIRIKGEKRMGFARMIHKGDRICLSGIVSSEKYDNRSGAKVFSVCIDADHVEWSNNKRTVQDENGRTTSPRSVSASQTAQPVKAADRSASRVSERKPLQMQQPKTLVQGSADRDNSIEINLNFADLPFS